MDELIAKRSASKFIMLAEESANMHIAVVIALISKRWTAGPVTLFGLG